ncbi:E3 ubiquitin-protein ligase TRIM39 isoform X1 [Colossoma macropomum]|uniref:E3 ubiquitin-protein ligase TRIM39 isoform X1 n=2 Tax=Colossoma macropomum TaxID=42526 RepID=UPI001863F427|nr:E3 ubiquitin-protein ligase TRIM39 isoform X1 [Colossoma macropomum]
MSLFSTNPSRAMPFLGSFLSEEQFQCSICLDIFDNPVSTPCGHSFCMTCIGCYWQGVKVCQCPLCKENFKKKPELHINRTLREITEQFKQMKGDAGACGGLEWERVQGKRIEERPLKQRQLSGDLFLVMKRKLLKPFPSKGSQNDSHTVVIEGTNSDIIQPQELTTRVSRRRYTLSGAASAMKVPQCPKHHRKLDLFCKSDGECICSECGDTDHQSHQIISAEKEWLNNKTQIDITETKIQEMIEQRLRKVEEIKFSLAEIKMAAEREKQDCMRVIGALLSSIEHSQAELLEVIEMRRRSVEHQAEGMLRELDLEVTELRMRSAALAKLAQTDCCISGLRSYSDNNTHLPDKDWTGVSVNCNFETKSMYNSVCQLLEHSREELQKLPEIYLSPLTDQSPLKAHPKVKTIQEYAVDVILDPSTAHSRLILSEDRKKVWCGEKHQHVPNNPERFNRVVCVLGQEGFTSGQHYWEVEVGGKTDWDLGVASHSVNRKGKITFSPSNGFWLLCLRDRTNYTFRTEPSTTLTLNLKPQKIGVFVDYDKGQVSFYNAEAKMLIYTFMDTFSEAIYPFFSPCTNKSGKNDVPLTITPVLLPD